MKLSPSARALVDAAGALLREDGPSFIAALKARDWKQAGLEAVRAELRLAAAAGLPGAAIALQLAPLARALAVHSAEPGSPPMSKAIGGDDGRNISTGA